MDKDKDYCAPLKPVNKDEYSEMFPDLSEATKLMDDAQVNIEMVYLPKECGIGAPPKKTHKYNAPYETISASEKELLAQVNSMDIDDLTKECE